MIEENKEKAVDAIFGEDVKTAIEDFASAYAEAWSNGEDRAESAKDAVKNIMRQMVTESIKSAIQASGSMEKIRQKLRNSMLIMSFQDGSKIISTIWLKNSRKSWINNLVGLIAL